MLPSCSTLNPIGPSSLVARDGVARARSAVCCRERSPLGRSNIRPSRLTRAAAASGASGIVKQKLLPPAGARSTQMRPWWRSTIRLQIDSPMPLPGYCVAAVQPLEDAEDALGVARVDPDAVVGDAESPARCPRARRDTSTRGGSSARNLIPLPIRFWNSWRSWPSSPRTVGRSPVDDRSRPTPRSVVCMPPSVSRTSSAQSTGPSRYSEVPDARVGEQVVDQALHAVHAVDREPDELVRVRVELAAVAARQQLHVARHHPQRLREVVRGDVGELLQVGVRALELGRAALELGGDAREALLGAACGAVMSCTCAMP